MSAVDETTLGRLGRRARYGMRMLTSPSLLRAQLDYLRHGPSPTAEPPPEAPFPSSPWRAIPPGDDAYCNICAWRGDAFLGDRHVESQLCPRCHSNGRDRFSFFCFTSRTPPARWLRVTETSPRLGDAYRAAMAEWFTYTPTDYDQSGHRTAVRLDLQDIDLPPRSIDVLLTAHVLEHVPDTDRALAGITRTLAPGGRVYLQVPVQDGITRAPEAPEFHEDDTQVFWRFGFDLAERLRRQGLRTTVLVTAPLAEAVRTGDTAALGGIGSGWDVPAMVATAATVGVESVLEEAAAERLGLCHSYQFAVFEGVAGCGRGGRPSPVRRAWRRLR
jgi:SAM-dependent methyltransferase